MATDNKRKLYDALSQDYDMGTYEQFCTDLEDEGKRRKLYDATSQDYDFGSWDSFSQQLGYGQFAPQTPNAPSSPQIAEESRPTENEMASVNQKFHQARQQTEAMFERNQEFMDNMTEYYHDKPSLGFRTIESKPVVNLESGKIESTYLTPAGERTTDKTAADKTSFEFRRSMAAADMSVGAHLRRAQAELEQLSQQRTNRVRQIAQEAKEKTSGGLLSSYSRAIATSQGIPQDKEVRALEVAIRQKEEQLKNLQGERDRQSGVDVGFWRGFNRTVGDIRTWDFGISDMLDASTMLNADKYMSDGATEGEKRAGQEMLKALHDNQQVEEMYGGNASFWNRAGVMTGYMPSFMVDFALTGGGFEAINIAGKAAARGAGRMFGEKAIKEMTEMGVKAYAKKYGVRGVGEMAGNWTIKALGTTADEMLIRAPLMTNTIQAGKTTADIIDRKLGDVIVDENGNYDFSNDRTWGSAVWQGEANAIIENYSEMFGTHLEGVVPALAKTFGGKRISGILARANASGFGKILDTTRKQFEHLGVSDYFGEVSEEYYGQLWRSMLNLDDAYQQNPDGTRTNLLFTGQFHGDIWGGMALSMGLMGAGKYSISGISYANKKHQVNKADRVAAEIFSPDRWEPIREIIDNTTNEDMGALAEGMINDQNLSSQERGAVMEYMERSLNLRGLNLGAMAQSRGTDVDPTEVELSESYIDGYSATSPQEMNDAQNMYEYQRQRLVNELGSIGDENISTILAEVESDPVGALMKTYDARLRDIVLDYANAKTVRDGVMQRVNDDIDAQIAQSEAMINGRVNSDTRMIQPATMGIDERQVYVVSGTLAVTEDGSIDRVGSDESIIIRDARTGELEFTDPKSIASIGEAIDPETEKTVTADNIRQQAAQAAVDAMNGTLAFNPGDAVQVNAGEDSVQATIVGPAVDETSGAPIEGLIVVQMPDGQTATFTKEQLQAFADAANLERLNRFEQGRAAAKAQQAQPQFNLNDEFTILNDNGTPIHGSITDEPDEDGQIEVYTEEPINGKRVNRLTPEEIGAMLDTYNGQPLHAAEAAAEKDASVPKEDKAEALQPEQKPEVGNPDDVKQSALSRIPVDPKGEPVLTHESVDPETGWDGAVEFFGSEEDALTYVNAQIKHSEATIASAEKAVGKIKPDGGMNKYREDLKNARAAVDAAKTMQARWADIAGIQQKRKEEAEAEVAAQKAFEESITRGKAELKQTFDEVKDVPEAVEVLRNMEPQSIDEVAALVLSANKVLWNDEGSKRGLKRLMGYGEGERRGLLGMFATYSNGGMSLERLAEDRMQEMCQEYGIEYDNSDALAALMEVIGASRTRGDILKYIQNHRIEQARDIKHEYDQHLTNEAERFSQEAYHMSVRDIEAYEEYIISDLSEQDKTFAEPEYNGYIADQMAFKATITNNQNGTENTDTRPGIPSGNREIQENDASTEGPVPGRGDEVLPQPQPNQQGGNAENANRSGIQQGNGVQGDGASPAVAQGTSGGVETEGIEKDENGLPFVYSKDGTTSFGVIREESGLTAAPIKLSEGYQDENGKGYGLRHIEAGHGEEIRNAGFLSVEEFVSYVAQNYDEDNIRVGKQRRNGNTTYLIQVTDSHDNTLFIELSRDGSYWNVNSGGIFRKGYSNKKETVAKTEPQQPNNAVSSGSSLSTDARSGTSSIEPTGKPTVSADKGSTLSPDKQGDSEKSSLGGRVKKAEAEVNTDPTEAQKEAGNYKKGHVQVGTFDVTIEQPVGSVRRGKDADGKEWETTMQNTYGYIRGTEGVDGDHIDVFLSTDIDAWDGRRVVVVDQYNPDGSFDEHKVMLGFNEKADAINAYLANYEKGWEKGRRLVFSTATLEDFEKWIESSHRKQKPYHQYKIAEKAEVDESTPKNPVSATDYTKQVTTFDELYKRVQDDIQQIQQMGSQSADVQREPERTTDRTASAPIRSGNNRPNSGAGQRPGTTSDAVRDTPWTDSGQPATVDDGSRPVGVDNAVSGDAGSSDNVPQPKPQQPRSVGSGSTQNGTGRSGSNGRSAATSRPDSGTERLAVKPDLTAEKVPYPNQSGNGFTLMSVVPAAQAQVLQKSLGEIGDVDQYLVDELGYSSKEELYQYLAAEQIDSVALAIHQMNKGNAFIIGDMTGVGKGRQGAALIRYAVKQGKVPIYFTQKPTLFTDNYRDLADIGSCDLRPFIIASNPKDANIVDADGNVVHKLPSKKEQERVFNYIMEHSTLPDEYDYVLTTYDQIKNGTADYTQNEDGTWNTEARKLPKKSKGYTTADHNGQARRDALARLAEGNIAILDESHTVGGDSGCGRYMQMLTSSAEGVTFLSATFAKRADNMPIYAQRTAIAEAGVKASELIEAISKGGVTLQEIMSKQLVESGQMIRRERSFEGVTIDWLSVEEETDRRQRQQFNEVADIFNAIRNFQDDYITPLIDVKNEAAAEFGATVGHTQGTKDLGVKNVPFASKMYNLVNQLLFALKVDAVADRVVENLRNGYKPVISFTNTMEGFLSSAPRGVAMDDVPNFSLTLMRALEGVMRFTEKDADENSEGGQISLSELSTDGQNAYNAIRDKIMNLSADLPISPMDAIRMKIEEAGYSVAEITGRTMQLNRTEDGRYIVEARKDRDKKAAMRDFNSGKLDVLMINKSGSTGISLHASSKFEDQRPRVMVFAQFQSDINDEVQMRGRIDRSGQVTRGRYEYIMSTIPAEQRIQMMFKAKLKSLDANTTSSQKSKFNEMEIVDYLNKYGDDVVWEYMKEHPELEERLGDPLDMLQEKNAEDGPRTSEKEDTSKKTGCAGKISRYLAFLSVEEQDEIFREITEAYRVKIQLLDDAGENDLEITTMPLRAETKQKKIWHEGENPGSGNAFADNTYVEEVEVDVLKKPMKRDEIAEATRKLMGEHYTEKNGGVDWQHYVRVKGDEISLFFQAKADEAVGKLKEAGEARIAKAREKAVTAATKARGRGENNFTDEQIQSLADAVANEEREKELQKQRKRQEEIMAIKHRIQSLLQRLHAGGICVVPQDLKQGTAEMFAQTFGTFVGFKFNKGYTLGSSTAIFATLDGRRKVELALSDPAISTIISATEIAYRYSPDEIRSISMDNWDSKVPTQTRQKRYIITGNLLQALVDTEKGEKTRGNLISYSTIDGETRQGILMGENFKLTDLRNSASLSSRLAQIREGKAVVSENGDVQIEKVSFGWQHRGQYELRVPKSKQRGGIYTMHPDLLKLVEGHNFITKGNNMVAYVDEADIAKVVDMLSRAPFNLTVLQESQLSDVSAEEAEDDVLCRPVTDKATLDRLNSEPTIKVYRAMQIIDGGLRPPMSAKVDGQLRDATEVGVWEEAEEHPEMADENGRFKLDKGNGKSIKAAYNPYIHTSRSPINDQFSSAWSRPELVIVEVEIPESELTSGYHAAKAKDTVGEMEWKSGPVGRALAKIGQPRRVILSRWSRIIRVVPVEEVAEAYAQRLNAHGIEVPFNTVPPALRDALAERGVKIGKPEKGNAGSASLPAFEQWISEQERQRMGDGYGAYSDAEVSFANDPISKVMGKNRFSKKRQAEFAARERQRMATRIQELAGRMHLDNVEILTDASQLEGKRATAKGFYNKRSGKITIVIPNNVSTIDAEQTLLHEAVAHYGLRQLFGEHFNTFLDNVYQSADEGIRRKISDMAAKNGWNFRTATEEYLAGLAEDTNFEEGRLPPDWWMKIKNLFLDMLEKIGFEGFRDKTGVVLSDNELRYILWRSYENLAEPGRYRSILGEAADVAKQAELKVGNYAEHGIEAEYAAEPSGIAEINQVNNTFNEQLHQQINHTLPTGHIYQLGRPGEILRSTGIPDLPIQMSATRLQSKATEYGHDFDLSEIKNLVKELQAPMAVFAYGNKGKMQNIVVGIESNGKQFIVGLSLNPVVNGKALEINSIRNVFPKDNAEWLNWISQGKMLYADKEKIQALIDKQRTILADVDYLNLDDVTKIVKSFENPTVEEEELFRPGDFTPRDKALARYAYERIVSSGSYQFKEAVQDSMLGLKKLYQAISEAEASAQNKNFRIEDIPGFENAYLFENRMSSMNAGEQHEYFIRYMQPLLKEIAKIVGADKRKRRELTDYLMAKHGLERNEYMRNEAAKKGEKTDRDFAGLTGLTGEADWQKAEDIAKQWVDDYEATTNTADLWDAINKATKATLEKVYLSGIISKETYAKILGMYQYYIPLRGWNETTSDQVYGYLTSKDGPLNGNIMKRAEGRSSIADDPIATIGMMADDAIRQGNRNLMKQRFLNFILNHPSDAVSIHDIWLMYDDVADEWRPVFADVDATDTADEVSQKVEAFEQRMEALRKAEPGKYKKGREAQHIPYKVVRSNLREHQILIKRNGHTFVATINGNPRAAQALNGLTNPDVDQNGVVGNMLKAGTWINRQLSAFYTTRNPDFVVGNFFRDMLYSNCMTWVKESPRYALRFHKNFGRVNPVVMRRLLGKWESGKLDMSNRLEALFYQFMKNGGETGYTNVRDIEGHKKAVAAELKKQGSVGRKAWTALGMQLDLLNRSAENCARFAAFMTSREFGRSIDRAIYDAKEVSVNFNKKGSGGKMVNANGQTVLGKAGAYLSGGGRLLYVFWNAGVQGMTNFSRQAKLHSGKFTVGASALFALGYVIPMLAQTLGGGDGDDDDKNAYYNLPEYIRRSNICFRAGEQWITIPLPIEYRAMYGMGELTHGVISGNERYTNSELGLQMAAQVSQIMPLDMLEGGGGFTPFIPSAAKPFTEAYIMNKGWTGLPVYKDTPFNKNDPEWTKAYASADKHLVSFAKWLNETSGGDDFKKGSIDINPAKIEYLLNGTFGGVFTFPNKLKKTGETMFGDRDFEWRNIPIANRLIKSGDERTANRKLQNEYFKYLNEYEATGQLMRKYENADEDGILGYAERINFLENSPEYARWEIFDEFKPDIDAYREDIATETDKEEKTKLEAEMYVIMRKLVNALHNPEEYINSNQE